MKDEQIKADVLNRLVHAGAFGTYHIPNRPDEKLDTEQAQEKWEDGDKVHRR